MNLINVDALQAMTMSAAAIVPIIVALTQVFKMTGWVQDKYSPFLALGLGVIVTFLMADEWRNDLGAIILTGLLFGLASSGLYSGVKASAHAIKQQENKNKGKASKSSTSQPNEKKDDKNNC